MIDGTFAKCSILAVSGGGAIEASEISHENVLCIAFCCIVTRERSRARGTCGTLHTQNLICATVLY